MNRQIGFANFFVFAKIFDCKIQNFFFRYSKGVFIFLNYCYWVCKHTQYLFCLIVPLSQKMVKNLCPFTRGRK